MPNAGYPRIVGNRMFYDSDPEYFAEELEKTVAAGASAVGGCCGTNPGYIAAVAARLAQRNGTDAPGSVPPVRPAGSGRKEKRQSERKTEEMIIFSGSV